jgi:hypothetical protein
MGECVPADGGYMDPGYYRRLRGKKTN